MTAQHPCEVWKHKKERGLKALTEFLGRMGYWDLGWFFMVFHPQTWLLKHETVRRFNGKHGSENMKQYG